MTLRLLKNLMLWLAIASYSLQAVLGGTGMAICLGQHLGNLGEGRGGKQLGGIVEIAESAPAGSCSHAGCSDSAAIKLVAQHQDEDACPCTDIAIDDSEPGRIENQVTFTALSTFDLIAIEVFQPDFRAKTATLWLPRFVKVADDTGPAVVRTTVFLI